MSTEHDDSTRPAQSAVRDVLGGKHMGVVALFIGKDGRILSNASDFNMGGYGGFSVQQSQEIRATRSLANEVMRTLSSPLICSAIDAYDAEKIMGAMCSRCGCRVEIVAVGYDA